MDRKTSIPEVGEVRALWTDDDATLRNGRGVVVGGGGLTHLLFFGFFVVGFFFVIFFRGDSGGFVFTSMVLGVTFSSMVLISSSSLSTPFISKPWSFSIIGRPASIPCVTAWNNFRSNGRRSINGICLLRSWNERA